MKDGCGINETRGYVWNESRTRRGIHDWGCGIHGGPGDARMGHGEANVGQQIGDNQGQEPQSRTRFAFPPEEMASATCTEVASTRLSFSGMSRPRIWNAGITNAVGPALAALIICFRGPEKGGGALLKGAIG